MAEIALRGGRSSAGGCHPAEVDSCPHCAAPLRPAATFCLACDRPVVDETSRLSVGEAVHVSVGRPLMGLLIVAGCLLVVGVAAYGGTSFVHHQHAAKSRQAVADVTRAATLLVEAEGGRAVSCERMSAVVAGRAAETLRECAAVVGQDPGAEMGKLEVDRVRLKGTQGSARVRATISDRAGTHTFDRLLHLVHARRAWLLSWDGTPL
jgi:hypothetical protein